MKPLSQFLRKAAGRLPKKRARTPTVLQMEAVECGAAALGSVLGYYGRFVPLEELRLQCGVSRDGSKASNLLRAARKYGLNAKGYKKELHKLKQVRLPAIVHWNFNHFLVVEGFSRTLAYLNDPAVGPKKVTEEEFDESFTGVVLTFEPGPDFQKGGARKTVTKALGRRLRGTELALTYIVLTGLLLVVPGLVIPIFTKVFVDEILVRELYDWFRPLLIGMALTVGLTAALTWLRERYLLRLETKIAICSAGKFFWHLLRLPIEFFNQRYAGEIGSRVATNDAVAKVLSGQLATAVINACTSVFYVALMFSYDALLTTIGVSIAIVNLLVLRYVARLRTDESQNLVQNRGKLQGASMGGLQAIETLKATGSESDFFAKWAGYHAKTMNGFQHLSFLTQSVSAIPPFLQSLNLTVILAVGALRVMDGHITMGMLVAFQCLMLSFTRPVNELVDLLGKMQEVKGNMDRLDDVLHYQPDPEMVAEEQQHGGPVADSPVKLSGHLELQELTYGYSRLDPPLIEGLSLTVPPGGRVALVGGSGSGKSTVAKLIAGLYQPWSGQVLFDGRPREELPRRLITNSIAMVDQEVSMFEGTIRDNLAMWDPTIPEAHVIQAAKHACIHDDLSARRNGYEHAVEEGGRNFRGGQRQRMEIARAIAGNPSILVLDEATSALDPTTEEAIDDSLRRRGCTCIIVAHRLSTIRDCDEIIVLDRGKVAQRGTHDEMKDAAGPYAQLIAEY